MNQMLFVRMLWTFGFVLVSQIFLAELNADLTITQIGDSVANNSRNRTESNLVFTQNGLTPTWIGDHSSPATFARGGLTFDGMLNGVPAIGNLGFADYLDEIDNGNFVTPDILYVQGGYNNVAFEVDDSSMTSSMNSLNAILDLATSRLPSSKIYVSNVTMFDGPYSHKQSNVLTLNGLIAAELDRRSGTGSNQFYLVDNYSVITAADLRSDGLHPNDQTGQQKIGANFANTVLSVNSVPEPNSMLIGGLILPLLIRRRRQAFLCS